jgi:DNA-binding transcriptional regulator YiaG
MDEVGTTRIKNRDDAVFLTERQLAERWNMSVKTIRNWRSNRVGPTCVKLMGAVRYRLSDIIEFEQANRRSGTSTVIANAK